MASMTHDVPCACSRSGPGMIEAGGNVYYFAKLRNFGLDVRDIGVRQIAMSVRSSGERSVSLLSSQK